MRATPMTHTFLRRLVDAFASLPAVLRQSGRLGSDLREIWRAICRRIRLMWQGDWPQRPSRSRCCFRLPDVYVRPDPLIYAQYYLMANGLAVTWDNPDIELFDGSMPVPSSSLQPDYEYEVRVRVWNGSYDAPAVGVGVTLSYLSFGIATTSTPVAKTLINLGVKGSAQHPAIATFTWRTPREPGHYCLQAQLHWHDDANPDNNLGQENVTVGVLASPAQFTFKLRNAASVRRRFVLEADAYGLPTPSPCDEDYRRQFGGGEQFRTRIIESRAHWAWAMRTQAYGAFPVPEGWSVAITPEKTVLDAGEEREIRVMIESNEPAFTGTRAFNIHGFTLGPNDARSLVGGVTLIVRR
jgi:hypothetical protein